MKLSANLLLSEVLVTRTGLDNTPSIEHEQRLFYLAQFLFQPTRNRWGKIIVTSGYRSPQVNQAVKGSPTSQHCRGEALDMVTIEADIEEVYKWIIASLTFGQAIFEQVGDKRWIHLSLPRPDGPNNQRLTFDGRWYKQYQPG